ncbi:hypothetical protein BLA60_26345 [Actinophytocola xinjiangensis]|uniref:LPXTG-motif cell wall-anchored protein n=1 Tax=Actinophytocola xinjiangensis TaxID=485602 RepID=A0A7Z0WLR4_9PSEU|nr:LPXTG cell wall anchor domain-containing protein [Actinophytocola xinjiangensis]OLF07836.1 hypothetical protein BLA60_26345 [Actinophytocola xinjiangensis]
MSKLLTVTRSIAVTAFAAATLLSFGGPASAAPDRQPVSGDDRATAHEGNAKAQECAQLFPGSRAIATADLTVVTDGSGTYLDITAIADGTDVVGVVVKGGPAYNRYDAAALGDLPWLDLHSPLVPSGKPAQISHWFACGVSTNPTTTTPPATTEPPTTTEPSTTPGEPTTSEPTTTDGTPTESTTTSAAVVPAADHEDLAQTGFSGGWLVALGATLLLGGGALLFLMRTRGARR